MLSIPIVTSSVNVSSINSFQQNQQNVDIFNKFNQNQQSLFIQTLKDWSKNRYENAKNFFYYGKKATKNILKFKKEIVKDAVRDGLEFVKQISTSHEDKDKPFCQIVQEQDCRCDEYQVQTKDGYILKMFRIRALKVDQMQSGEAPAILLQHGLFSSADTWISHFDTDAPAFVFARAGYDVWLGNNRGNKYSRHHVSLDADRDFKEFFDYSFQDLGEYDLPAQVQKVIDETGRSKISYIGHSQGTSQMFYGLSQHEKDIYQDKINLFVALAPVTKLKGTKDISLKYISKNHKALDRLADKAGLYEIFGPTWAKYENSFCKLTGSFCTMFTSLSSMVTSKYNDEERIKLCEQRERAGASRKQLMHFAQLIHSNEFQAYNYGSYRNMLKYGTIFAPIFDLSKINTVPIALISGDQDVLATPENAFWAQQKIQSSVVFSKVLQNCDHSSFLVGKDMSFLQDVLTLLSHYNSDTDLNTQSPIQNYSNQLFSANYTDSFGQISGLY